MAKTRTTRRERRLETEKQMANGTFNPAMLTKPVAATSGAKTTFNVASPTQTTDLTTEYFYVYTEVRNILIVAVAMLVVLFGLSQFI